MLTLSVPIFQLEQEDRRSVDLRTRLRTIVDSGDEAHAPAGGVFPLPCVG